MTYASRKILYMSKTCTISAVVCMMKRAFWRSKRKKISWEGIGRHRTISTHGQIGHIVRFPPTFTQVYLQLDLWVCVRKGAQWFSSKMTGIVTNTGELIILSARGFIDKVGLRLEIETDIILWVIPCPFLRTSTLRRILERNVQ